MSDRPVLRGGALVVAAVLALVAIAALMAAVLLAAAAWCCVRHPRIAAAVAGTLIAFGTGGPAATVALWALAGTAVLVLRAHHRAAFDRHVLRHWRRTFVYGWRWRRVLASHDLARPGRFGRLRSPRLGNVWSSRWADVVSVHPLDGQDLRAFGSRADALARSFGALTGHVQVDHTGVVRLEIRRGDLLRAPVPAPPVSICPDPAALPMGRREDGSAWTVSLDDGHLLVVGAPGTARSVVWSLLRALAAPVRAGTVEVWAVDGSGGLGLAAGSPMFTEMAVDPHEATVLVRGLTAGRGERAGSAARSVPPSLSLLVLHDLGRWAPEFERRVLERLAATVDLGLDYGRELGLVIVATAPVAPGAIADRFPQRITLGSTVAARSDSPEIGTAERGGSTSRVRIHRIGDRDIAATAAAFPAPSRVEDSPPDGTLAPRAVAG